MAVDAETYRLMENWARWRAGCSMAIAVSSAYSQQAKDAYDTPLPLMNGDAVEVNQAVDRLEAHLQRAVTEFWCWSGVNQDKALRAGCGSVATLYRRLDQAHAFIHAYRHELRRASARMRAGIPIRITKTASKSEKPGS